MIHQSLLGTYSIKEKTHLTLEYSNIVHNSQKCGISNSTPRYLLRRADNICSYKNL